MKIGFIGLGNMGGSLARVVAGQKNHQILLANRSPEKAKQIAHEVGANLSRMKSSLSKQM